MVTTVLIFIAILAVLVLTHEFGHFIVAKKFGCRVDEFGFGFPPKLFGWKKGDTEYTFNLLPLGGFVKIKGENGDDEADPDSFGSKSAMRRIAILAAGVAMNILTAVVLMMVVMGVGVDRIIDDRLGPSAIIEDRAVTVVQVLDGSPAATASIEPGDILQSVEGLELITVESLRELLAADPSLERDVIVERNGEPLSKKLSAYTIPETGSAGFGVALIETGVVSYPMHVALWKGVTETWWITSETFKAFGDMAVRLVRREPLAAEVAGPVGIAVLTGEVVQMGYAHLLQFIALLSVNLAIINLLPIPALDGGRILFVLIEKLRGGKKVSAKVEGLVHMIGFVLLLSLILFVTYKDVLKLF